MAPRERPAWPIPIGLIAAIAAGFLIYQTPLKTSRPGPTEFQPQPPLNEQQVQARLWQDPLAAAEEHARAESSQGRTPEFRIERDVLRASEKGSSQEQNHHRFNTLTDEIQQMAKEPPGDVTVLLVLVPGGPYVEGAESRLRTRYAVVSALGVACFVPEDSEHIGYVEWNPHPPVPAITPYEKLTVPYEWYRLRKFQQCEETRRQSKRTLVVWLNEDAFSNQPLQRLSWLTADIKRLGRDATMQFKIIGPASSTTLRAMLEEAMAHGHDRPPAERIDVYSPWATAKPGLLALSLEDKRASSNDGGTVRSYVEFERQFATILNTAVDLHQGIGYDDTLALALLQELHRRGVEVGQDHIAWLAEWDSFYGRALQVEFSAAACVESERIQPPAKRVCPDIPTAIDGLVGHDGFPQWRSRSSLHHYSYLRGLDGEIPGDATGHQRSDHAGKVGSTDAGKDVKASLKELERPEGHSQLDYVHRLVARLEADAALWEGSGKELKAIGVLGSDVYDKLLILQALRKRFPKAIFFTTDLDARLLHPSQYDWTRNLIVASHFGLQLHPALQGSIPSFRDSYQTSTFFSVLTSLGHLAPTASASHHVLLGQYEFTRDVGPRIYEVGRTQAIDLSPDATNTATTPECDATGQPQTTAVKSIHPAREPFELWHVTGCGGPADSLHNLRYNRAMWGVIAVFLACVLLIPFDVSFAKAAFASAALFGATLLMFWYLSLDPAGEPFYWFEGVSIWPTEVFRMVAAGLSLVFLYNAVGALRRSRDQLTTTVLHHVGPEPFEAADTGAGRGHWWDWVKPSSWGIRYSRGHTSLMSLWDEYGRLSEFSARRRRLIPQVLVYGCFGFVLLFGVFTAPSTPFRGAASEAVDRLSVFLSVFSFLALIFFVVDETRLCEQFIRRLTDLWRRKSTVGMETGLIRFSIDVIAARTQVVGRLIDYPFIVLLILIVGRIRLFDNWDVSVGLVLLWGFSAGYAVICGVLLSRAAEYLREAAITSLNAKREDVRRTGNPDEVAEISRVIDEISMESAGAFAPWTQHPVLRAVLFPTSGVGLASLFEYFSIG